MVRRHMGFPPALTRANANGDHECTRAVSGLTRGWDPGLRLPVPAHSGGVQTLYLVYRCGGSVGIACLALGNAHRLPVSSLGRTPSGHLMRIEIRRTTCSWGPRVLAG